jgi:hypothetical protein
MKKPFEFTERSATVACSNPNCAKIRGAEGVSRMPIKENVIARSPDGKPLECYDCAMYRKTGLTRKERKNAEQARKQKRAQAVEAKQLKTMTANA